MDKKIDGRKMNRSVEVWKTRRIKSLSKREHREFGISLEAAGAAEVAKRNRARQQFPFEPNYATEPGETLQETLNGLAMSESEFARRTGLTVGDVKMLIDGVKRITPEIALQLEMGTAVPAHFWNNLEANYQERSHDNARRN